LLARWHTVAPARPCCALTRANAPPSLHSLPLSTFKIPSRIASQPAPPSPRRRNTPPSSLLHARARKQRSATTRSRVTPACAVVHARVRLNRALPRVPPWTEPPSSCSARRHPRSAPLLPPLYPALNSPRLRNAQAGLVVPHRGRRRRVRQHAGPPLTGVATG
jgi:hypothetical protein